MKGLSAHDIFPTLGPWRIEQDEDSDEWLVYGREPNNAGFPIRKTVEPLAAVWGKANAEAIVEALNFAKAIYDAFGDELFEATPMLHEILKKSSKDWQKLV